MRSAGWIILILLLTLAGVFGLVDFSAIFHFISTHPHLALECIVLVVLSFAFVALRMATLLGLADIRISYFEALKITMLSQFYGNVLVGPVGAEMTKFGMLVKNCERRFAELTAVLLLDRIYGLSGMVCVVFFMSFAAEKVAARVPYYHYVIAIFILIPAVLAMLFVAHEYLSRGRKQAIKDMISRRAPGMYKVLSQAGRAFRTFKSAMSRPQVFFKLIGLSMMASLLPLIGFEAIIGASLPDVFDFSSGIMILAITMLINSIGITPGGIGVGEGVFALICFLVTGNASLPYIETFLVIRLVSIMCVLPGGVFLLRMARPEKRST